MVGGKNWRPSAADTMCTLVLLRRPDHEWPLLLAANRDEMSNRPWSSPERHWPDRPNVVAGRDELAEGSWLGINDEGMVAGIMNREGALGPSVNARSRGELVLEALDHADARVAADALSYLDPAAYRAFNLVVADAIDAFWICHRGGPDAMVVEKIPTGLSMFTARDRNDMKAPRIKRYLSRFEASAVPTPEKQDWSSWKEIMASRGYDDSAGPVGAMTVVTDRGFGTMSSSLIAMPRAGSEEKPIWLFADGSPDKTAYKPVTV